MSAPLPTMHRSALIDPTGTYRYRLGRRWSTEPAITFVMLNPSTADADVDDPTIRRCIGFARREGAGGITVVNLFGLRATDPAALRQHTDPVGDNGSTLGWVLRHPGVVVAAWGAHPVAKAEAREFRHQARIWGKQLHCLGMTKGGHPRHPLYVAGWQPLVPLVAER